MGSVVILPDNCPPDDSVPCSGTIYRLVAGHTPIADDFMPHFEKYPGREWGDDLCKAHGLSILLEREDVSKLTRRIKALQQFRVATARLDPPNGSRKQTGAAYHHTWWPSILENLAALFTVEGEATT
jgi:hypothetical protein